MTLKALMTDWLAPGATDRSRTTSTSASANPLQPAPDRASASAATVPAMRLYTSAAMDRRLTAPVALRTSFAAPAGRRRSRRRDPTPMLS